MEPFTTQEINKYREQFPVCKTWTYLNHAGVAPVSRRVAEAVEEFNREALHQGFTSCAKWSGRIREVRQACARLIGASAEEIAFVKNTSHGISLVARGLKLKAGDEVIIAEGEFPANVYPWMALQREGVVLKKIPLIEGELALDALEDLITPRTRILSLSSVQYGNGFRLPVAELGNRCRERGILFMVDAIQSLGALPLDVHKSGIDFLSADAHKWMLGHEGIGLLYVRRELIKQIEPVLLGWNSVQGALQFDKIDFRLHDTAERFEEGSHNGLSIYGLGAAVDLLLEVGVERIGARILDLTARLIDGLKGSQVIITNSLTPKYRSGIVTFRFPEDPSGEKLSRFERHLFEEKIYTTIRQGSLRISPHFYNTEEEMQRVTAEVASF